MNTRELLQWPVAQFAVYAALIVSLGCCLETATARGTRSAFVNDDGTLRVNGRTVHLFGIHIPETAEDCRSFQRPVKCAPRAALALDFKIAAKGVRCKEQWTNNDRSITAICTSDNDDLSAYLLSQGWAVALPNAPIDYRTREEIARHRNLGVWGFAVDPIVR